jgi:hypothetical protein
MTLPYIHFGYAAQQLCRERHDGTPLANLQFTS